MLKNPLPDAWNIIEHLGNYPISCLVLRAKTRVGCYSEALSRDRIELEIFLAGVSVEGRER